MKKLADQAAFDAARGSAGEMLAPCREVLTNDDATKQLALKELMHIAQATCENDPKGPKEIAERLGLAQAQELLKICGGDGFTGHDYLLAIAAFALEHGKLLLTAPARREAPRGPRFDRRYRLPKPLCEYVAKVLRQMVEENYRKTLRYRDLTIFYLLCEFQEIIPLFPNPATLDKIECGISPKQTYACDIVIGMLKEIGIDVSRKTLEQVWYQWISRHPLQFPFDGGDPNKKDA